MRSFIFTVQVEIPEYCLSDFTNLNKEILSAMEEIVAKAGYDLYDSSIEEDTV